MATIAIHQPNFFPWLGYFFKMSKVDVFVFLDDAPIQHTGSSWSNRVLVANLAGARWMSAPLNRHSKALGTLQDVVFEESPWRQKMVRGIEMDYGKHAQSQEDLDFFRELLLFPSNYLVEYNIHAITRIAQRILPRNPILIRSSSLNVHTVGTQRLVDICKSIGGTQYLFGAGAAAYQDDSLFEMEQISVARLKYIEDVHLRSKTGATGLSVIDSLLRCGMKAVKVAIEGS